MLALAGEGPGLGPGAGGLALGAGVGYGAAKLTRWGIDRLQGRYGFPALGVSPTFNLTTGPMVGFSANF